MDFEPQNCRLISFCCFSRFVWILCYSNYRKMICQENEVTVINTGRDRITCVYNGTVIYLENPRDLVFFFLSYWNRYNNI